MGLQENQELIPTLLQCGKSLQRQIFCPSHYGEEEKRMLNKSFLSTTMISLFLVGSGLGMSTSHAVAGTVAYIESGHVVLRTGPATTYKAIATVPTGAKVKINGCLSNKTWCSIHHNGRDGWAFARYLNVNNVPTISFVPMRVQPNAMIKIQKEKVNQIVPLLKTTTMPKKMRKQVQQYRVDVVVDATGVKKRDERTILNPSPKAHGISVEHVTAYNPLFPDNVNFKNFERNETRYRVITYPAPSR